MNELRRKYVWLLLVSGMSGSLVLLSYDYAHAAGVLFPKFLVAENFDGAHSVYAADVDGDGDQDVLGAARVGEDLAWWENSNGDGSAWTARPGDGWFRGASSVYAADVDGDNDIDMLGAGYEGNLIAWLENVNGDGLTWSKHPIADGTFDGAYCVYAADVDNDGDVDVLGAATTADKIVWWENVHGSGLTWTEHTVAENFDNAGSVKAADIDGDGDIDVVGTAYLADDVAWWENINGNGLIWTIHTIDGNFDGAVAIAIADVDGDGHTDVVGAAREADQVAWWENTSGDGATWTTHPVAGSFDGARSVQAADLDGDGDVDIVGAAWYGNSVIWWENTNGNGTSWVPHTIDSNFDAAIAVETADLNGDGDPDVLGAAYNADDIVWWRNDGPSFTISGATRTAGGDALAGVTLHGFPLGTLVTASDGTYTTEVASGWSGTITPQKLGYLFNPPDRTYTNVSSDQAGQDYTGTDTTFTISGSLRTASGRGIPGVYLHGFPEAIVSDRDGNYHVTVEAGWSGEVTPQKVGYTFEPATQEYTNITSNITGDTYTGTPTTVRYEISGYIRTIDGRGIPGVYLDGFPHTVVTMNDGFYRITVESGWSGTITSQKTSCTFTPASQSYTNITTDRLNQNYTGTCSGSILRVPSGYTTIQAAIDAASNGDTVVIADGTYIGTGNKNLDFKGKAITVQSENGPENTIIDCEGDGRGFYFHSNEGAGSVLSGVGIHQGYILGGNASGGSGIYCYASSPTITDCILTDNIAEAPYDTALVNNGGGIFLDSSSSATIISCIIADNIVQGSPMPQGGGISCTGSSPDIVNNIISHNKLIGGGMSGGGLGAGIYISTFSSPTVINNTIVGNISDNDAGGIYVEYESSPGISNCTISGNIASSSEGEGGGILHAWQMSEGEPVISDCLISKNSAWRGGGIAGASGTIVTNCLIRHNTASEKGGGVYGVPQMSYSTISENSAGKGGGIHNGCFSSYSILVENTSITNNPNGGGIDLSSCGSVVIRDCLIADNSSYGIHSDSNSATITNSTITRNTGDGIYRASGGTTVTNCVIHDNSGHGISTYMSSPTITNCTITGNGAGFYVSGSPKMTNSILWENSSYEVKVVYQSPTITYSDIQGGYTGEGNIDADPLFVNPDNGNYYLTANSPCMNTGSNNAPNIPATDKAGNPRITDGTVDMGAYEYILQEYTLTVNKTGSGAGTVTSSPAGIACGTDCMETYWGGTHVTLNATPDTDSVFTGWSGGGCSGTDTCAVTMNADTTVTAAFNILCEPGDMDCNGQFNIFDLQRLINCIFGSGSCDYGDLNDDGNYNIFDVQQLINKIFM